MNTLKQKLTSRKLWVAVVGVVVGLATVFGLPENEIAQVAGSVVQAMSIVAYILGEAKIDAKRIETESPVNIKIIDDLEMDDGK